MSDSLEIYFSESLTPNQRELAEQSIASTVERMRARADAARARWAEEDKLREAITAPLAKLMQANPGAAEALEKLSTRQVEAEGSLRPEGPPRRARDHVIPVSSTDNSVEVRLPPYDYAWSWHQDGGDPPFSQIGDREGNLGVDARSGGLVAGGAGRFVNAHHGVGCIVRVDRRMGVFVFATRLSRHSFVVGARGIGANATGEGGFDYTFMRGPSVIFGGTLPLFRRRVSGPDEVARDNTSFTSSTYPGDSGGETAPGEYNFNVGIYGFADHTSGIGGAGVQSLVQSRIDDMRIHRQG